MPRRHARGHIRAAIASVAASAGAQDLQVFGGGENKIT
jgi:hypothetical protein